MSYQSTIQAALAGVIALGFAASTIAAVQLARLLRRIQDGTISGKLAKDVFDAMWAGEAAGAGQRDP